MNRSFVRYARNPHGRDLIVGDIHGCYTKLRAALQEVGFDPARDRLFSVGDLVDRGPESHLAMEWLRQPWFKAVRGNHEEAAIAWAEQNIEADYYARGFGGGWNIQDDPLRWGERAAVFAELPLAIELETERGLVGIVHADCPMDSWDAFRDACQDASNEPRARACAGAATWGRDRWKRLFGGPVAGVRAVVVGHEMVDRCTSLDNVTFIDTMGWKGGHFTILDAATLTQATHPARALDWSGT